MKNPRNILAKISAAVVVVLAVAGGAVAKRHSDPAFSNIHIRNFGKMDDRFYRGAQPDEADYKDLKALGIRTIIDLQDSPTNYEKRDVEALGMRYVNIPMSDSSYPKQESINAFLKLVNDPATGKFFAHCAGGRHRTGTMTALYRMTNEGWTAAQAYNEMKQYHFEGFPDHPVLRSYVYNYKPAPKTPPAVLATSIVGTK